MDALVLVVDDHEDTREGYEAYLKFIGARVATASNAEAAIVMARDLRPDIIVMDGKLPGMSGPDAMRVLKADVQTKSIPIIALSGRHPDGAPCDLFLMKPSTPQQLAEAIRDILPKRKVTKQSKQP